MTLIARALPVSLGADTSEDLTGAQYATLRSKGYTWIARYVPHDGQSPTAKGILQPAELTAALGAGFAVMLVQYPRSSGWSAATGLADGKAAAAYALGLGYPPAACLWCDLNPCGSSQIAIDYVNAWTQGIIAGGMLASAAGLYCEPGVPLTAAQRYSALHLARYWATAANDPERFPAKRGCQLVQLWGSSNGEIFPAPGIVIDGDAAQQDYLGGVPLAAYWSGG